MLRSRTYYGLTNERVIIISGLSSRTVKSLQVQTLTDVSLSEEASGTGTVMFGPNMSYSGRGSSAGRNPQPSCCRSSSQHCRDNMSHIATICAEKAGGQYAHQGGAAILRAPGSFKRSAVQS